MRSQDEASYRTWRKSPTRDPSGYIRRVFCASKHRALPLGAPDWPFKYSSVYVHLTCPWVTRAELVLHACCAARQSIITLSLHGHDDAHHLRTISMFMNKLPFPLGMKTVSRSPCGRAAGTLRQNSSSHHHVQQHQVSSVHLTALHVKFNSTQGPVAFPQGKPGTCTAATHNITANTYQHRQVRVTF
jgi:hypothetical protein